MWAEISRHQIVEVHDRHRRTVCKPRKQAKHKLKTGEQLVAGRIVSIDLRAPAQALQNRSPLPGLPIDPLLHCTLAVQSINLFSPMTASLTQCKAQVTKRPEKCKEAVC